MSDASAAYLLISFLLGLGADELYHATRDYFSEPMSPDELDDLAADLRKNGGRSEQLAQIADRLALGDDPNQIINELPEDVRADFEQYMKGGE